MSSEGTPLHGDRGVWNVMDFDTEHAKDIMDSTLRRHLPLPGAAGGYARSDGTDWQRVSSIALADLADYSAGFIIVGGAADWEAAPFDWDTLKAAAGADMVHGHTSDAEGGTLTLACIPDLATTYLKLDASNDPVTGALDIDVESTSAGGDSGFQAFIYQTDGTGMTGTLRGGYLTASGGDTANTGTIRGAEIKARAGRPGETGNDVAVLEGFSISSDAKTYDVTTHRGGEIILDGGAGTSTLAVGLRIANNFQANRATTSYGLQIYRDSFDYTADIQLSYGHTIADGGSAITLSTALIATGLTLSGLGAGAVQSSAADVISSGPLPLTDLASYTQGDLIYGGAADWQDLAHPGAANRVLQSTAAEVGWSATAVTFPTAGAVPVGSGAANRVAYWSAANALTSDAGLTVDPANDMYIVADGGGIGIGAALERIEFHTAGYVTVMGANFGIGAVPTDLLTLVQAGGTEAGVMAGTGIALSVFRNAPVYIAARDTVSNIEYGMGTSAVGASAFIGAMTNHALDLRTNNVTRMRIDTAGDVLIGTSGTPDRRLHAEVSTAGTAIMMYIQRLAHVCHGGAVLAGSGAGIEFELEENDGTNRVAATIEALWTDAGETANADADFIFKLMLNDGAAAEKGRLTSGGDWKIPSDYYSGGNQGLSGTLTLDDGANWRITLTFLGGILTGQTTGASVAAAGTWV